jgi:uncharacterized membrane protein (DUF441 family)
MESWLFLALILVVALVGKNMSLIIATGVVMLFKLLPFTSKWLPTIQAKGINWGVTVISVAILSRYGVDQLAAVPQVIVALVLGTIIGVVVFKGVAAGPVIASGMTYLVITLFNLHF